MPKYLIASTYYDHETDMCGSEIEAADPFSAILQDCAERTDLAPHEAAHYLENDSWAIVVFVHDDHGSRRLRWEEHGYPWQEITHYKHMITEIQSGLDQAKDLEKLFAIPGMDEQELRINLQPARTHLAEQKKLLIAAQCRWAKMLEAPGGNKEPRSIDVDGPTVSAASSMNSRPYKHTEG